MSDKNKMTKEEISWILYDVANSAFILIIITTIGQIFFKTFAAKNMSSSGSTALWGYAVSGSSLVLAFLAPILGTLADHKGYKKRFLFFFVILGIFSVLLMTTVQEGQRFIFLLLIFFSWIGFAGANIFYDAFLVDVTDNRRMDWVSANGFAWGYIGSIIPFALGITLIFMANRSQLVSTPTAMKFSFVITALWWFFLSMPIFKNVSQVHFLKPSRTLILETFKRLFRTFIEIKKNKTSFLFLIAYFFYIDGVQTIIKMAVSYGQDAGIEGNYLLIVVLVIQILAFPFALIYGKLAKFFGTKKMLYVGIVVYIVITLIGFFIPSINEQELKKITFWILAVLVASSQGGIQALSRSFFGKLIPKERSAEFFGFYNIFGKFAAIMGPFAMGLTISFTGDSRFGVLILIIFFIAGILVLSRTKISKDEV